MQLSVKKVAANGRNERSTRCACQARALSELKQGEHAILDSIELDADDARRMMEMGFLPGTAVVASRCAPSGDPRVYQVDGSEIALRRETAARIRLRHHDPFGCLV